MIKAKHFIHKREVCHPFSIFASVYSTQIKIPHSSTNVLRLGCHSLTSIYKTPCVMSLYAIVPSDYYPKKATGWQGHSNPRALNVICMSTTRTLCPPLTSSDFRYKADKYLTTMWGNWRTANAGKGRLK